MTKPGFTATEPMILAVDTSSRATSLAVARGRSVLTSTVLPPDHTRSETMWNDVRNLLAELRLSIRDVDVFSVCTGPGGFTGLRVGMAAVMGFSAAADKPLVGITSLEATAFDAGPAELACAVVNAYKGEVYSQLFSVEDAEIPIPRSDPMVSPLEKVLEGVTGKRDVVFVGDGAEAQEDEIVSIAVARGEAGWAVKRSERGLASAIAGLAFMKHERGETQNLAGLRAFYIRPSEAEIKLSLGLLGSKIKRSMKPE